MCIDRTEARMSAHVGSFPHKRHRCGSLQDGVRSRSPPPFPAHGHEITSTKSGWTTMVNEYASYQIFATSQLLIYSSRSPLFITSLSGSDQIQNPPHAFTFRVARESKTQPDIYSSHLHFL
jgi:hypothetical protein